MFIIDLFFGVMIGVGLFNTGNWLATKAYDWRDKRKGGQR